MSPLKMCSLARFIILINLFLDILDLGIILFFFIFLIFFFSEFSKLDLIFSIKSILFLYSLLGFKSFEYQEGLVTINLFSNPSKMAMTVGLIK